MCILRGLEGRLVMASLGAMWVFFGVVLFGISVFLTIMVFVAVVKVIQIAEDLRYIRSRTDISVERPKTTKDTLTKAGFVAAVITMVLTFSLIYMASVANLTRAAGF